MASSARVLDASINRVTSSFRAGENSRGPPFIELVKKHGTYGLVLETSAQYDVRLIHGTISNLHWIILLKMKDSKLPYITHEITTKLPDMTVLIPSVRTVQEADTLLTNTAMSEVGVYTGSLEGIAAMADEIISDMETYNLIKSNCQNFCNCLLKKMKLIEKEYPTTFTTFGADPLENKTFDIIPDVFEPVGKTRIHMLMFSSPQMNDLIPIFKILKRSASKWRDIASKLHFDPIKLDEISKECYGQPEKCLHEFLTRYLTGLKGCESYEDLASAVQKVDTGTHYQRILRLRKTT
jgi:hypothetical protein